MSVQLEALQAQIDQVSADIERQKDLLKKLERSKSSLQRQLNDLRDPIARLPLEISSDIFIRCLPPYPEPGADLPRLLLKICNAWTDIALSTPALWARINLYLPRPSGFEELLKLWFQRAGGHSLHISATTFTDNDPVTRSMKQSGDDDSDSEDTEYWNIWASAQPQPLPLLQSLIIFGRENLALELLPFMQLLRLSPNLSQLVLNEVEFHDDADGASEKLMLPNLRSLIFKYEAKPDTAAGYDILTFISAPHLQTLALTAEDTLYDDWRITSFLDRSKPPLQELVISHHTRAQSIDEMCSLLTRISTLVPPNILAAFKELSAEGMDIKLGHPSRNLLFRLFVKVHALAFTIYAAWMSNPFNTSPSSGLHWYVSASTVSANTSKRILASEKRRKQLLVELFLVLVP
ncbi:hypothetical protein FB45DRAFT_1022430 [Roridomyces roridus]|uniref:F-box domain-containing protein n=1 Tax=Roridomyces roridus TaxID=1738132 RepID=A0AAD7C8N0_9AGAR|nr:hypothetical protein FB45DRAFT_1022430 [Roridomyces roridus]